MRGGLTGAEKRRDAASSADIRRGWVELRRGGTQPGRTGSGDLGGGVKQGWKEAVPRWGHQGPGIWRQVSGNCTSLPWPIIPVGLFLCCVDIAFDANCMQATKQLSGGNNYR